MFVNKLTLLCFHFKFLYLVFAMLFIIYTFCCHVFSHHFYNAYTLKLLFLIIRNVTTKKCNDMGIINIDKVQKIGHFRK